MRLILRASAFAVVLLGAMALMGSWDTNKSSGTDHSFATITTTGAIVGSTAGLLPKGKTFISIAETVAGTTPSRFYIRSKDIYPGSGSTLTADTISIGGRPYDGNFVHGVDSLAAIQIGGGAEIAVEVTN